MSDPHPKTDRSRGCSELAQGFGATRQTEGSRETVLGLGVATQNLASNPSKNRSLIKDRHDMLQNRQSEGNKKDKLFTTFSLFRVFSIVFSPFCIYILEFHIL